MAMSASPIPCASMVGRVAAASIAITPKDLTMPMTVPSKPDHRRNGADVGEVGDPLVECAGLPEAFSLGDLPDLGEGGPRVLREKIHRRAERRGRPLRCAGLKRRADPRNPSCESVHPQSACSAS